MLQYFAENKTTDQPKYTSEDFIFRWKKIQRIVEKQGLDGLLLITGLDGAEHPNTSYLFNWLFLGMSGQAIFTNRYLEEIYSEIIVFISNKASFIFITPEAKKRLNTLIYTIQNCTIFCPTDQQFNSKDQFEILKIAFFYSKISKFNKIGFFLQSEQQTKIIEKWPIIQSYALEPVGRTFFTLKFQTQNLSQKLSQLFKNLDKNSLQNLIYHSARSLEGQLVGSLQLIQLTKSKERELITELKLQQPLFESADISGQSRPTSNIRVLFGARTGRPQESKEISLKAASAFHFTVQHTEPLSKLSVWRTYFVDINKRFNSAVAVVDEQQKDTFLIKKMYKINSLINHQFQKRQLIINSYLSLVQAVIEAISTVSKDYRNLNHQFLSNNILLKINQLLTVNNNIDPFVKSSLLLQIQSFDSMGQARPIDLKDSVSFKLTSTFYVIKCRLNDIIFKSTGQQLGSVCFSEGFLLQEGCYLLITKNTPYFQFWKCSTEENNYLQNLNPNIQFSQLGQCLTSEFKNRMFIPLEKLSYFHFNISLLNITYYLHEKGIRIFNEKIGWHLLLYEWVEEASMINKINGQWVLFRLQKPLLFQGLQNNLIALQFRGKAFDYLLQKVNDKINPLPLTFIDIIPSLLSQNWYFTQEVLKKEVREGAIIHQHQILQYDFLWSFIQAKQLMILNQMKDIKLSAFKQLYQLKIDRKIQALDPSQKKQIIIINGGYATNKLKLAQTISKYGQANIKYHIFNISSENLYSKIPVDTFLEMLQQFFNQLKQQKCSYTIVVIPSWLNCSQALNLLAQKYHVRSVLTKINVSNFYINKNSVLTQNVLTFALPGFCQSIVIDCEAEQQGQIAQITNILWAFNRQARIMRSSNGMLSTRQCLDITKDNSYNTENHKFLRNKYGSMYKFDQLASLSVNYVEFKFPIVNLQKLKQLTKQEGYLVNLAQIQEQLKSKKMEAQLSKDELMEGLYRLEELVTLYKKRQKVPQLLLLRGVIKQQDGNKSEIVWSNQIFKINPANTQRAEGIFILSKNYDEIQLKEMLLELTRKKIIFEKRQSLKRQQQLSPEQKVAIGKNGRDRYLQNGQFYDGYFFRDVEGHILENHPNLSLLVRQYLESQNEEIQKYNAGLQREWEQYCKKYT